MSKKESKQRKLTRLVAAAFQKTPALRQRGGEVVVPYNVGKSELRIRNDGENLIASIVSVNAVRPTPKKFVIALPGFRHYNPKSAGGCAKTSETGAMRRAGRDQDAWIVPGGRPWSNRRK